MSVMTTDQPTTDGRTDQPTGRASADDPAWDYVKALAGLRREPKEAWRILWNRAGRRPTSVWVSYQELADELGTSARSGRRYIRRLATQGLIAIVESPRGRARVFVWEPREVARSGRDRTADQQRPLLERCNAAPPSETAPAGPAALNPSADVRIGQHTVDDRIDQHEPANPPIGPNQPADPPIRHRKAADVVVQPADPPIANLELKRSAALNLTPRSLRTSEPTEPFELADGPHPPNRIDQPADPPIAQTDSAQPPISLADLQRLERDGRQRTAAEAGNEQQIAGSIYSAMRQAVEPPGQRECIDSIGKILRRIDRAVADPRLRDTPKLRVARAIVDGRLPAAELDTILVCLNRKRDAGELVGPPWGYFVGAARRAFANHGLDWPTHPQPRSSRR